MDLNKKIVFVIGIILIVSLIVLVLIPQEKKVIKIGFTSALSGTYANYGDNILKGVEEAINEQNILSDKIELLIEDNQANPTNAVNVYQLFKNNDVKIVLSSFSGVTSALNPLSKEDKVILIYNAMSSSFAEENKYAFKIYADATKEANVAINWLTNQNEKLGVVYVDNSATNLIVEEFDNKLTLTKHSFNMQETDYRTIITKLKEDEIKGVILLAYSNQMIDFIKQSIELGFSPNFILSTSDGTRSDVISAISPILEDKNIDYLTIGYGQENQDYIFGYDATKILILGLKECEKIGQVDNPDCLENKLKEISIEGKSGFIDMSGTNIANVFPELYKLTNNKLVSFN